MSITRYGTGSTAAGGQPRPFARAVEADGWLYVSGCEGDYARTARHARCDSDGSCNDYCLI